MTRWAVLVCPGKTEFYMELENFNKPENCPLDNF